MNSVSSTSIKRGGQTTLPENQMKKQKLASANKITRLTPSDKSVSLKESIWYSVKERKIITVNKVHEYLLDT